MYLISSDVYFSILILWLIISRNLTHVDFNLNSLCMISAEYLQGYEGAKWDGPSLELARSLPDFCGRR